MQDEGFRTDRARVFAQARTLLSSMLIAVLPCGCAEKARYPKVDGLFPGDPQAAESTESSKIASATYAATMGGLITAGQEAALADAVRASPWSTPCPVGMKRCHAFVRDRRGDPPGSSDLSIPEIRDYTRSFINGLRSQKGLSAVEGDAELDAFAQRRAEQFEHEQWDLPPPACASCSELYGPGEGMWPMPVEQQVDTILSVTLREGPGQRGHDTLLGPEWHRAGVGIVNPGGELYFTVVLSP
jgi:hypothetical protein